VTATRQLKSACLLTATTLDENASLSPWLEGGLCSTRYQKEAGRFKNETLLATVRLVKMKHVELFTQHRFKATIGHLLKHWGINAPISTAWQHL
jgi:hypothetical protein